MSPSLFLVCLFLIAACTEGAVIDKEKGMNDTALLELVHHISKRHNIPLEPKQASTCTPTLPSGCSLAEFAFTIPTGISLLTNSYFRRLSEQYSKICTRDCVGAIITYYRCINSEQEAGYLINFIDKFLCGQESGEYCPVRIIRSLKTLSNGLAFGNMLTYCSISLNSTGLTSCSSTRCTSALRTFSSIAGCCTEPFLGSGVRSCSGVSVPDACTGVSSATGIIATPIVGVSLMILALAGVFL